MAVTVPPKPGEEVAVVEEQPAGQVQQDAKTDDDVEVTLSDADVAEDDEEEPTYESVADILEKKFKGNPVALAKAYETSQSYIGKQGNKIGEYKKVLQDQGYTFDADDKPIAPAPKEADPKPVAPVAVQGTPFVVDQETGWHVDPSTGRQFDPSEDQTIDGKLHHAWRDKYGTYDWTEADWAALKAANPDAYLIERPKWETQKLINKAKYEEKVEKRADAVLPASKTSFEAEIAKFPLVYSSPIVKKALADAEVMVKAQPAEVRADPRAYPLAVMSQIFLDPAAFFADLETRATDAATTKAQTNPKIIAGQSSGGNRANGNGQQPSGKLSADQERARQAFNKESAKHNGRQITAAEWGAQ